MRHFVYVFALLASSLSVSSVHATEIELAVKQSQQTKSQEISGFGEFGRQNSHPSSAPKTTYNWNASYSRSVSSVTTTSNTSVTDTTHDVSAGLGLALPAGFFGELDFDWASTPEEELTNSGPGATVGYKWKFTSESDEDEFRPYGSLSFSFEQQNFEQKFTVQRQRRIGGTRPVSGSETISQNSAGAKLKLGLWSWLTFKIGYQKYSYNKDVNQFLQYLDNRKVLAAQSLGMSQALAGFYDQKSSFEFDFYLGEQWELDLVHSIVRLQIDGSSSTSTRFEAFWDLVEHWRLGLGAEISKAGDTTSTSGVTTDTSFLLSGAYSF